jgi:hypothetical protein
MIEPLLQKTADIEKIAEQAMAEESMVGELVAGLTEKNEDYRSNCSKVLRIIGQIQPELMYPYWDKFTALMDSDNSFHRMSAINHLASLAVVDKENKFENIFGKYYRLLDDQSVIVGIYIAQASGRIALAKPSLQKGITDILLAVDKTHHLPGRKELIKAGIIGSFDQYMADYHDKSAIFAWVKKQIESESPKTRNLAKAFMKKWDRREKTDAD